MIKVSGYVLQIKRQHLHKYVSTQCLEEQYRQHGCSVNPSVKVLIRMVSHTIADVGHIPLGHCRVLKSNVQTIS